MTLEVWDRPEVEDGRAQQATGRRRRLLLLTAVAVALVLLVVGAVAVHGRAGNDQPLDPRNAGPDGARAVAQVLTEHGVPVEVASGQDDLLRQGDIDGSTTVVITRTEALSDETAAAALRQARDARRVVLVEPGSFALQALGLPVDVAGGSAATRSVRAGCSLDGIAPSDTISAVGEGYASTSGAATSCFTFDNASSLVAVPAAAGRPDIVVLGAGEVLANGEITRHDNAGVALRLLGRGDRVVWYIPSFLDVSADDTTPTSEIPRALWPLVFLCLVALLATMLWRGRRFGPLVTEPLPAVVKAIETTQSRARLYRRARDTGRAAAILRAASMRRLTRYLGLPAGATAGHLAEAVARATGRPVAEVQALLDGPPPADETAMIVLANDLSTLEKEVHRP